MPYCILSKHASRQDRVRIFLLPFLWRRTAWTCCLRGNERFIYFTHTTLVVDVEISPHAREAMAKHDVSDDEVHAALAIEPRLEIEIKGELRYGSVMVQKTRKLVVIWTPRKNGRRVITCYPLRRKA